MYLSCLLIDVGENPDRPRPGRLWLRDLYRVHQRLCMAFPSSERKAADPLFLQPFRKEDFGNAQVHVPRTTASGFLFRIEPLRPPRAAILVQSAIEPDWEYAFQNAGYLLGAPPQVTPWNPVFSTGQLLRFRLVANATRKIDTKSGPDGVRRHGRRVPVPYDQLPAWLERQGQSHGFQIWKEHLRVQPGYDYCRLPGDPTDEPEQRHTVRYFAVRFDGVLQVTEPEQFSRGLASGIGPAKAFGFGLLTVAPISR